MRIDLLRLENFKKFVALEIELPSQFTLLVGDNGAGKTSILDAVAIAASIHLPDELRGYWRSILRNEVRLEAKTAGDRTSFDKHFPVVVSATGRIGSKHPLTWERRLSPGATRTSNKEAQKALDEIRELFAKDRAGESTTFPVLAYYGAGRAWLPSNQPRRTETKNGPAERWAAFKDCFNERIRFDELRQWFSREHAARGNRQGRWRPGFEVVRRAVLACVPDADDVYFDVDLDGIVLSIQKQPQPFDNLSAGQRMMLALVADLAIKCVTQNAYLVPPDELDPDNHPRVLSETPGLVLIDELDVHLHPKWQRRVASDLKKTFPSIQFLCTSHSPQVIGELHNEEIWILDENVKPCHPKHSYGQESSRVLEEVMGATRRNAKEEEIIRKAAEALDEENFDEVNRLLDKEMIPSLGEDDPEVTRVRALMDFLKEP